MKETIKKLFNEITTGKIWQLLLVLSVLGILAIYMYNFGYFTFFNIDISFLKINSSTDLPNIIFLFFQFLMLALFILGSIIIVGIIYINYPHKEDSKEIKKQFRKDMISFVLLDLIISFFSFLFIPYISIEYNCINYIAIIILSIIKMATLYVLTIIIIKVVNCIKNKSKLIKKEIEEENDKPMPIFDTISILVSVIFIPYILGTANADLTKKFQIIEETQQIIIYNAGDYAIVCPYEINEEENIIKINKATQKKISLNDVELKTRTFKDKILVEE